MESKRTHSSSEAELGTSLPNHVALLVADALENVGPLRHFALADIHASGTFGEIWVALSEKTLAVVNLNGPDGPAVRLVPLGDDVEMEIVLGVGSSRFRIVNAGKLEEELRFSTRQAKRFSKLLHAAQARIKGEEEASVEEGIVKEGDDRLCEKCHRLIPDWADSCPRCLHKRQILWRLLAFAKPYKRFMALGWIGAFVSALLMLVPPRLTRLLIDDVLKEGKGELLWKLIGILAATYALRLFFNFLRLNQLARMSEFITHDLRREAFSHLQKLSLSYYSKKPTGQLISRITHDTDRLWDFITFGMVEVVISIFQIVAIGLILFMEEPVLALLTVAPVPIGLILSYFHVKRMRSVLTRIWAHWSEMTSVLSDVIPGVRVVKAFKQEDREIGKFTHKSQVVVDDAEVLHKEWTSYWPRLTFLLNLGTLAIWAYAGPKILGGTFSLGTFVMFLGYVWMFYGPIEHLGMMNRMFQRAITSGHRVFSILDTPPTIYTKPTSQKRKTLKGTIGFQGVSFSYDGVKRVLQDVTFSVGAGEVVGLAGPSGGGKTTTVNLICRFYDPVDGRILIDGVDLRDWDLHELRSHIGVVLQEPYLFRGSVAENIAYGNPDATVEEIIEAARVANAHDFIVGFPDGYDTLVGERGQTVSGGERQRLSIARALLNNPKILILDEATSSVDSKTEMKIQEAIDRLVEGRTTIAIAHRLSTLRKANRLVILDKGKLVEQGSHEELMKKDGMYAGLHKTQTELNALFAI